MMEFDKFEKGAKLFMLAVITICIIIIVVYTTMMYKEFHSEKFTDLSRFAQSYSSGATQRFQQENTDPTLGGHFGPYNMDIRADKAMLGSENLTSSAEPPVVYNEPGLHNMQDSAEAKMGPGNDVDDLISELYN